MKQYKQLNIQLNSKTYIYTSLFNHSLNSFSVKIRINLAKDLFKIRTHSIFYTIHD